MFTNFLTPPKSLICSICQFLSCKTLSRVISGYHLMSLNTELERNIQNYLSQASKSTPLRLPPVSYKAVLTKGTNKLIFAKFNGHHWPLRSTRYYDVFLHETFCSLGFYKDVKAHCSEIIRNTPIFKVRFIHSAAKHRAHHGELWGCPSERMLGEPSHKIRLMSGDFGEGSGMWVFCSELCQEE